MCGSATTVGNTSHTNCEHRKTPDVREVIVARIRGAWGLDGSVKVEVLTEYPSRFSPDSIIYLDGQAARVERSRTVKNGLVVKLDLVDNRTDAKILSGRYLTVPTSDVKPLPKGSYYYFQLIDIEVWSVDGERFGWLKQILPDGGAEVYVAVDKEGNETLFPALAEVVLDINLQQNRMIVRLPEGLR